MEKPALKGRNISAMGAAHRIIQHWVAFNQDYIRQHQIALATMALQPSLIYAALSGLAT